MLPTSEADAGCTTLYLAFLFAGRYVETSAFRLPEMAIFGQRCGQEEWPSVVRKPSLQVAGQGTKVESASETEIV